MSINDIRGLWNLRKERPLAAAFIVTAALWLIFFTLFPLYPLDAASTVALFALVTVLSYGVSWIGRFLLRRLAAVGVRKRVSGQRQTLQ